MKRMELLESNQQRLNVKTSKKHDENNRCLDVLLSQIESERRLDTVASERSRAALAIGNSPSERGDSSVGGNYRATLSPVTPVPFTTGRDLGEPEA
ncbi:uncharacterized protein LOC132632316 isoform X2 [Lycium barbarum]|uniref:uncharacterized protein LOC132632316 isoform X2 n=1 Tax=Lycium barbarum TaxID=112863 RepID=UPI00293E268D|nr:uncharacterized protein LOC132632316 isoform X2 [Lycium barbarum]